ncbi:MAG: metallophosphatase family protein, partial [Gemmatimonadetes bacterium]|nr:metallophosphatase family protein [Gemmatimonadota bacterium]
MLIGLISDTHGLLRPEVFKAFEGVELILHAGDIGDPDILTALQAIAPVTAVWGNTDDAEIRDLVPEVGRARIGDGEAVVVHGQQFGSPTPRKVVDAHPGALLVVFGHSHKAVIRHVGATLAVNPGSAGPVRFGQPITCALAT